MIQKFNEFVSEGLWKSGVERAKTNSARLEDITPLREVFNFFKTCIKAQFPKTEVEPKMDDESKTMCCITFSPFDGKNYFLNLEFFVEFRNRDDDQNLRTVYTKFYNSFNDWNEMNRVKLSYPDMISNGDKKKQDLKKYQHILGIFLDRLFRSTSSKLTQSEIRDILLDTTNI